MNVILTLGEVRIAAYVAVDARARAIRDGAQPANGASNDHAEGLALHVLGAWGEVAFAKATGTYWLGASERRGPDVGSWHVRTVDNAAHRLLLHDYDDDDAVFVLVDVSRLPDCAIVGWILGRDGKLAQYWQTFTGRPCFMVPREALHAPDGLVTT